MRYKEPIITALATSLLITTAIVPRDSNASDIMGGGDDLDELKRYRAERAQAAKLYDIKDDMIYIPARKGIWGALRDYLGRESGRELNLSHGRADRKIFDNYWLRTCKLNEGRFDDINNIPEGELIIVPVYNDEFEYGGGVILEEG